MREVEIVDSVRACSSFTLVCSDPSACTAPTYGNKPSRDVNRAKVRSG